jgi:hypothetical protein
MTDYELNHTGTGGVATSCDVSSNNKVTISNMAASSTGRQFTFRLLATFVSTTTSISNAQTKLATTGELIDRSTTFSFTRDATTIEGVMTAANTGIALDDRDAHTGALTAGATGTDATATAIQIAQTLNSGVSALQNSVVTISFPFSNSAAGTDIWYFGTTNAIARLSEIDTITTDVFDACGNSTNQGEDALTDAEWNASANSYLVTTGASGTRGSIKMTLVTGTFDGDGSAGAGSSEPYINTGESWCL